jgi:hypothetical protein
VLAGALATDPPWSFTDSFDRPDSTLLGNGWTETEGDLSLAGNAVRNASTSGYHTAVQASRIGSSLTASADFARLSSAGGSRLGVVLRYQDSGNYYFLGRLTGGTSQLRIVRVVNRVERVLASAGLPNPGTVSFTITGHADGATLALDLNGVRKLTATDATFASGAAGFQVGSKSSASSNRIDNFSAASSGGGGASPTPTRTPTALPPPSPTPTPAGGGGVITDKGTHPEPPLPALPPAGGTFVDPTFGTTILRVTDAGDGTDCGVHYSYWPSFNANDTRFHVQCGGQPLLYRFDPSSLALLGKEPLFPPTPDGTIPVSEDAIWSAASADAIYAHDFSSLWRYDTAAKSYARVANISALLGNGHKVWQMSRSADDDVFAWTEEDANYNVVGYLAYQRSRNAVVYRVSTTQLDEVQIDKSGRYLLVKTGLESSPGQIRVKVVDLALSTVTDLTNGAPDYACGHSDNGGGTVVGADNWNNTVQFRSLAAPHSYSPLLAFGNDWTQAFHLSALADNEGWVLVSSYSGGGVGAGPFHREIYQVATDGSQRVRRLAHHRSLYSSYYDSPRANISRDGAFAAFTSNWGGSSRRDAFILRIPPAP